MSRIGKKPIEIPQGVEVKIDGQLVTGFARKESSVDAGPSGLLECYGAQNGHALPAAL